MNKSDDMNCQSCGWHRSFGCRFDCPDKKAPTNPRDYTWWADEQKRQYGFQQMRNSSSHLRHMNAQMAATVEVESPTDKENST